MVCSVEEGAITASIKKMRQKKKCMIDRVYIKMIDRTFRDPTDKMSMNQPSLVCFDKISFIFLGFSVFCKEEEFQCSSAIVCLDDDQVCDQTVECLDRSDEQHCGKGCFFLNVFVFFGVFFFGFFGFFFQNDYVNNPGAFSTSERC